MAHSTEIYFHINFKKWEVPNQGIHSFIFWKFHTSIQWNMIIFTPLTLMSFYCNSTSRCAWVWGHIVGTWETHLCSPTEWFSCPSYHPMSITHFSVVLLSELLMAVFWFFFLSCSLYANILCVFTSFNKDTVFLILRTQLQDFIYPLSLYGKHCFKNKAKQP